MPQPPHPPPQGLRGPAARGKTGTGRLYGPKPHPVINHKGQVVALKTTPGHTAGNTALDAVTKHPGGKPHAGKGYVGRRPFSKPWQRGLRLVTGIRRNMRNHLMPPADEIMPRKRFAIETALDTLKSGMALGRSRQGSVVNAMVHVLPCLVAYAFRPGKPSIPLANQRIETYP